MYIYANLKKVRAKQSWMELELSPSELDTFKKLSREEQIKQFNLYGTFNVDYDTIKYKYDTIEL